MHETCRVAFVGAGYMASEHLRAFAGLPRVELAGLYSRTAARASRLAEAYPQLTLCASIPELYGRTQAELVVIAVNELSVKDVAHACFAFPWTVLIEKPAGYNLADAATIARGARQMRRNVLVALNRRCYGSTRAVRQRLDRLAGSRFIKVQDQEDIVEARQLGKPDAVIANWMYANAIHLVDYFRVFGRGEVAKVHKVIPWNPEAPGFVVAHLEFESGDIGLYEAVWNRPAPWAVTAHAARERYELRPLELAGFQINGQRQITALPADPLDQLCKPGLRYQAQQAIHAARGEANELSTIDDAYQTMQLVARIYGDGH